MSQRAVMIDRDGVINNDGDHVWKIDQLKILPRVSEAIQMLNDHGWIVIVITNQPVVARGWATEADVEALHAEIGRRIAPARIDRWYYCPHHPNPKGKIGANGINRDYVKECECRKPKPGMILQAMKELGVETPSLCYMTGDSISDIKAGNEAGCKTILVDRERAEKFSDAIPNHKARDLYEAVTGIILKGQGD